MIIEKVENGYTANYHRAFLIGAHKKVFLSFDDLVNFLGQEFEELGIGEVHEKLKVKQEPSEPYERP